MQAIRTFLVANGPTIELAIPESLRYTRLEVILLPMSDDAPENTLAGYKDEATLKEDAAFYALAGSWQTIESGDELAAMIEAARTVSFPTISL